MNPPHPAAPAAGWTILIPVKSTSRGKSRLDVPPAWRRQLATAMAMDTVSAAARCASVVAVVEDAADAHVLGGLAGVRIHLTSVTGLNESIRDGLKMLAGAGAAARVAVLPGDLPGLRPAELEVVLDLCSTRRFAVVADHQGVGTTLLTATEVAFLDPHYGPDSFRRHQQAGATPVDLPTASTLRRDVDTVPDLDAALGPFTLAALAGITTGRPRS